MIVKFYFNNKEFLKFKIHCFEQFLNFFKKNSIDVSFDRGDFPFIITDGPLILKVARDFPKQFSFDSASKLFRKDTMTDFLTKFGFNYLETVTIKSLDDIKFNNFIIKPIVGYGYRNIALDAPSAATFEYKKFKDKDQLIKQIGNLNKLLNGQYIAQKTSMGDSVVVRLSGTFNSKSETYFVRNTISQMIEFNQDLKFHNEKNYYTNGRQRYALRTYRGYEKEKALVYDMIKELGFKNGTFSIELVDLNGTLYPIDFNFNLSPYNARCSADINLDEFEKPLYHMFDIPNHLPETFPYDYEIKAPNYEKINLI